jgi:hypothetical protein
MAYNLNGKFEALEFNAFADQVNEVYSDSNSGATTEATAGFGYGQSAISAVTLSEKVTAAQWDVLLGRIHDCASHQGTSIGVVPVSVSVGGEILFIPALQAAINSIRANKFNNGATIGAVASAATTSKSGNWDATQTQTVTATFANWNAMRYFFNASGKIRFSFSFTGTPDNTTESNWVAMSGAVSNVSFGNTDTISSGGVGNSSEGIYDLTATDQQVYSYVPSGYTTEQYTIQARLGAAPGSASSIIFTLSYITPSGGDIIDLTLNSERAIFNPSDAANNITIATPTISASAIS